MRRTLLIAALAAVALVTVACADDGGNGGSTSIDITLQEWAVVPSQASTPAGEITFAISNDGQETHEFVVIRTDLPILDLPTNEDGSVSEEGEGMEVIDEVEDIPSGDNATLTITLEAGSYALICNIVEEENGEVESHFQMGMRTSFEVQ
jgi:uncharacterized cupredoxin-like copper-binding protein